MSFLSYQKQGRLLYPKQSRFDGQWEEEDVYVEPPKPLESWVKGGC